MNYSLNKDKIKILRTVKDKEQSLQSIAEGIERSVSWTSSNISSLRDMGLVFTKMRGLRCYVERSDTDLSRTLYAIISEYPYLSMDSIFGGKAFSMLPWLIDDGLTRLDLIKLSGISKNTVSTNLTKWLSMGIISKKNGRYRINDIYPRITDFLRSYWKRNNYQSLINLIPDGTIVWEWRDQFIFATNRKLENVEYPKAAMTRLSELGHDLISRNFYYFYGKLVEEIGIEEAFIQSISIGDRDPRILKIMRSELGEDRISLSLMKHLAPKYELSWEEIHEQGKNSSTNKG